MKVKLADTIAIIDADLIGRKKHRFPNLACEKISAYFKDKGEHVVLKLTLALTLCILFFFVLLDLQSNLSMICIFPS